LPATPSCTVSVCKGIEVRSRISGRFTLIWSVRFDSEIKGEEHCTFSAFLPFQRNWPALIGDGRFPIKSHVYRTPAGIVAGVTLGNGFSVGCGAARVIE